MRVHSMTVTTKVLALSLAAALAVGLIAAVGSANAALPAKNTLYTGTLTAEGQAPGSIRIKTSPRSRSRIAKVVVRAPVCEGKTTVRKVKNIGIQAEDEIGVSRQGSFGANKEIAGTLFELDGMFTSRSKADGEVFVGESACNRGVEYEFIVKKVVAN